MSDIQEVFVVERIIKHRKRGGRYEFLVKWKNWPDTENTWILREDFVNDSWVTDYMKTLDIRELFNKGHPTVMVRVIVGLQSLSKVTGYGNGISKNALIAIVTNYFPGTQIDEIKAGVKEGIEKKLLISVAGGKFLLTKEGASFDVFFAAEADLPSQVEEKPIMETPEKKQSRKKRKYRRKLKPNWNREHTCDRCAEIQIGKILTESEKHPGMLLCDKCVFKELNGSEDHVSEPEDVYENLEDDQLYRSPTPPKPAPRKLKIKIPTTRNKRKLDDDEWLSEDQKRRRVQSDQYYGLYKIVPGSFNWQCSISLMNGTSVMIDHRDEEECARLTRSFIKNHEQTQARCLIFGQRIMISAIKYLGPIERCLIRGEPVHVWHIPEDAILVAKTLYYSTHGWPRIYSQAVESMLKHLTIPNIYALPKRTLILTFGRGEDLWEEIQNTLEEVAHGRGRNVRDKIQNIPIESQAIQRQQFVMMLLEKVNQYGSVFEALDAMGLVAVTDETSKNLMNVYTPLGLQRFPIVRGWVQEYERSLHHSLSSESSRNDVVSQDSTENQQRFLTSDSSSRSRSRSKDIELEDEQEDPSQEDDEESDRSNPLGEMDDENSDSPEVEGGLVEAETLQIAEGNLEREEGLSSQNQTEVHEKEPVEEKVLEQVSKTNKEENHDVKVEDQACHSVAKTVEGLYNKADESIERDQRSLEVLELLKRKKIE